MTEAHSTKEQIGRITFPLLKVKKESRSLMVMVMKCSVIVRGK
jgi:hypothetical protein